MESHDQLAFQLDDKQLHHGANFCLQAEFAIPHESTIPSLVLQESEMNIDRQHADVVVGVTHDGSKSVVENGGGFVPCSPAGKEPVLPSDCSSSVEQEHTDTASATDDTGTAEICTAAIANVQDNVALNIMSAYKVAGDSSFFGEVPDRIDYGESVAIEDFGGEFNDGHGIEECTFAAADVFADNAMNNSAAAHGLKETGSANDVPVGTTALAQPMVTTEPAEQLDLPESLDRIVPKSPADEGSAECEDEPPVLEREVVTKSRNLKHKGKTGSDNTETSSSKVRSRRSRQVSGGGSVTEQAGVDSEQSASNVDLNVNSRPRRSVNRKSVFEMLHVDYRYAGGPKKVSTPRAADSEINQEPTKKQKSNKKSGKLSNQHAIDTREGSTKPNRFQPISRDLIQDIDDRINTLKNRVVSYRPDDFMDDGDGEPEVTKNKEDNEGKVSASKESDRSILKESIFSEADDRAARSFLTAFAAESAEALSSSSQQADGSCDMDTLIAENQDLRSRIKALEQSKSLVRKFNIDFHGRKFSRIRSPAGSLPDQQKTEGKVIGSIVESTPTAERKVPVESSESMLSRMAVLDRREHKLREVSAEMDERATSVRIAEGALQRKERKLVDFEKTLEHRERVLSRHEQNILKRELELGSLSLTASGDATSEGPTEDRQSFAIEIQRRLEQRRLELDRRQTLVNSERARLQARERELNQLEAYSSSRCPHDNEPNDKDLSDNHTPKRSASVGKQKRKASVSQSIRSKYLSPKKQKVSGTPSSASARKTTTTPNSTNKAYVLRNR